MCSEFFWFISHVNMKRGLLPAYYSTCLKVRADWNFHLLQSLFYIGAIRKKPLTGKQKIHLTKAADRKQRKEVECFHERALLLILPFLVYDRMSSSDLLCSQNDEIQITSGSSTSSFTQMASRIHIASSVSVCICEIAFKRLFDKPGTTSVEQIVDNIHHLKFGRVQIPNK